MLLNPILKIQTQFHMELHQTKLQRELDEFIKFYPSTKVLREKDELIYVYPFFYNAKKSCSEANYLIEKYGWDLVAIHGGSSSFFIVKSNETE